MGRVQLGIASFYRSALWPLLLCRKPRRSQFAWSLRRELMISVDDANYLITILVIVDKKLNRVNHLCHVQSGHPSSLHNLSQLCCEALQPVPADNRRRQGTQWTDHQSITGQIETDNHTHTHTPTGRLDLVHTETTMFPFTESFLYTTIGIKKCFFPLKFTTNIFNTAKPENSW